MPKKIIPIILFLIFIFFTVWQVNNFNSKLNSNLIKVKVTGVYDDLIKAVDKNNKNYSISLDVVNNNKIKIHKNDKILINKLERIDGTSDYVIVDFVRITWVYILILFFIVIVLLISKKHGLKSLINLLITLLVIIWFIVPLILKGYNPVIITVLGSVLLMAFSIYFLFGWQKKSHTIMLSIIITLIIAGILSNVFVKSLSLTGLVSDEVNFLLGLGYTNIDMRNLLLAAIIVGVLGVLDDLIVNQVSIVEELIKHKPNISARALYKSALKVGEDHASSMINTLVLAYIGSSFPLMILLVIGKPPMDNLNSILNNEIIATELTRTLIGTSSLLLAVPISTFIAVILYRQKQIKQ